VIAGRLYLAAGGTNPGLSTSDTLDIFSP